MKVRRDITVIAMMWIIISCIEREPKDVERIPSQPIPSLGRQAVAARVTGTVVEEGQPASGARIEIRALQTGLERVLEGRITDHGCQGFKVATVAVVAEEDGSFGTMIQGGAFSFDGCLTIEVTLPMHSVPDTTLSGIPVRFTENAEGRKSRVEMSIVLH